MSEARLTSNAQTSDCSPLQHCEEWSEDTAPGVPDLGPASTTFQTPLECYDVAVSWDGCRLLLAALELGLLEFDLNGAELSRWRPAEKTAKGGDEWVTAVEALQDGRVAVGLCYSQRLVLLTPGPAAAAGTWLVNKRITGLGITPWRLSVHGDLVAVAEWSLGRRLSLLSLTSGLELSRQQREYEIGGVAVTSEAVLTSSDGRVKMSGGSQGWAVDACSHDGQVLWRKEFGHRVADICSALSGRTLYMALCESNRVTAVKAKDGNVVKDLLSNSSHGLKSPSKVSMGGRGQQTVGAVLCNDNKTVTVYKAKLGQ